MENRKKRRQFWLGMAISAACLAAIFLFIEPAAIGEALKTARYGYLALTGAGLVAFVLLRAVRWRFMLNNELAWNQVFHIQNIGYMLTMLLPFRLGDVARAVLIGNVPPVTIARGVSTMVVERILDMMFIVTLLPFTLAEAAVLPVWMQAGARGFGVASLVLIVILIVAAGQRPFVQRIATFIFNRIPFLDTETWARRVDELLAGLNSLTRLKDGLILIVLSVLIWLPIIGAYYTTLTAVHIQPTWAMAGFTVCAAAFSVALPSSPGQVGVFHAAVTIALTQVLGQPDGPSASFAFLYHALNVTTMVVLGLIGLSRTGATFSHVVASTQKFMRRSAE
jgi:uncharacterized protein (TIRG00374 family)